MKPWWPLPTSVNNVIKPLKMPFLNCCHPSLKHQTAVVAVARALFLLTCTWSSRSAQLPNESGCSNLNDNDNCGIGKAACPASSFATSRRTTKNKKFCGPWPKHDCWMNKRSASRASRNQGLERGALGKVETALGTKDASQKEMRTQRRKKRCNEKRWTAKLMVATTTLPRET